MPPPQVVLLSIKPHYADLIERGMKVVEFRRRFPRGIESARAVFYVTAPIQRIDLAGEIDHVGRATPPELWRDFSRLAGVARDQFDAYFAHRTQGVALILRNIRRLARPLNLTSPRLRSIAFRPPQSLSVLPPDSPLLQWVYGDGFVGKAEKVLSPGGP
jgi:predicted transcriptional regulator